MKFHIYDRKRKCFCIKCFKFEISIEWTLATTDPSPPPDSSWCLELELTTARDFSLPDGHPE